MCLRVFETGYKLKWVKKSRNEKSKCYLAPDSIRKSCNLGILRQKDIKHLKCCFHEGMSRRFRFGMNILMGV